MASSQVGDADPVIPEWDDWDESVWEALRAHGAPLIWSDAQKLVGAFCREHRIPYGRDSRPRRTKFVNLMVELYGDNWENVAAASQRAAALQRAEQAPEAEPPVGVSGLRTPDDFEPPPLEAVKIERNISI